MKKEVFLRPLKVALFGLTHPHSRPHLKSLQLSPLVSSIVLYDEDPEVLEKVKVDLGTLLLLRYRTLWALACSPAPGRPPAPFSCPLGRRLCPGTPGSPAKVDSPMEAPVKLIHGH